MDRRKFLQLTAGGLLLSITESTALRGESTQEVSFASDDFSLAIEVAHGSAARLRSLRNLKTGFEWLREGGSFDPIFALEGRALRGWSCLPGKRKRSGLGDRFEFVSRTESDEITANTTLQSFADAPVIEFQTTFRNSGDTTLKSVTSFGPFRFALRADIGRLRVHSVRRDAYNLVTTAVDGPIDLTGGGWNAPQQAGLIVLEAVDKSEFLLLGIEWERDWHYRVEKDGDLQWLSIELSGLTHDMGAGEKLITPRVFIGIAQGDRDRAFLTARRYLQRHAFPELLNDWPWVVYDFWATDAKGVQDALLHEVEFAAGLGVDVFVHDASWYAGSSEKGTGDWGCGLGNYQDDRQKFPMGLAAISKRVHASGMKFGLWVGPNVVDSRLVGTTIPKLWLARIGGKDMTMKPDGWESSVDQVCLGCREYIDFLKSELPRLVREYALDWLKWDNSGIPASPANCTRADHGHQAGDASYASLVGQYEIFEHLHSLFPELVLEQCGYGSRLDYGLARTIRANWLNDASYPSESVRHGALVGSRIYPSGDNGGWIVAEDKAMLESASDPAALDTIFRSRMFCLFGFGTLLGQLKERISLFPTPLLDAARRNIAVFKRYRHLLLQDSYVLLEGAKNETQAIQFVSPSGDESVVLVFKGEGKADALQLPLHGLKKNVDYQITFINRNESLRAASNDLLSKGISANLEQPVTSEVICLTDNPKSTASVDVSQ